MTKVKSEKPNQWLNCIKFKYVWFIAAVTVIKLLCMGLFSSEYQNRLFIPFVTDFCENGGNVYQRFYENGIYNSFPYPPAMLLIESVGFGLSRLFDTGSVFWSNFFFKMPSFLVDIIGLKVLEKFYPDKKNIIAVLYYASPIILYAVYMHSQLDLIPMIMLMIALLALVSNKSSIYRYTIGILFTAASALCKLHILAVIPIILLYLQKRDNTRSAVMYLAGTALMISAGIAPVLSDGFIHNVLLNAEQSVLTKVSFRFDSVEMYIPILSVFFIYLITFKITYMNRDLFLNLCGIVFAIFLAFCPPMPGWYVWIVPFFTLFLASLKEEKNKNLIMYTGLNILYLIYFVFLHNRGYVDLYFLSSDMTVLKINNHTLVNFSFTILSGMLIYLVILMYQLGVASNNLYKRKNTPFTIGIAGDSGAGKSTMIQVIEKGLGSSNILCIEGDGDHKWERGNKSWNYYTALNPKANYLYKQAQDILDLQSGNAIKRSEYDHSTGQFTSPKKIRPKKYMILCGLHALYLPLTRKHLDLKIYMDADETLRRYWKIQRDTEKRGHSKETVVHSIEERMPDAEKFIYPQKNYADIIVKYYDKNLTDCMVDNYSVKMSVQITLSVDIDIEPLVNELRSYGVNVEYDYSDNLCQQIVTLDADSIDGIKLPIKTIAGNVIPQLEEITREKLDSEASTVDSVIILFLLLMISYKMQGVI